MGSVVERILEYLKSRDIDMTAIVDESETACYNKCPICGTEYDINQPDKTYTTGEKSFYLLMGSSGYIRECQNCGYEYHEPDFVSLTGR